MLVAAQTGDCRRIKRGPFLNGHDGDQGSQTRFPVRSTTMTLRAEKNMSTLARPPAARTTTTTWCLS